MHVFYAYVSQNGYHKNDVVMFVLFFAHQCNTTITIVNAMVAVMCGEFQLSKKDSFYRNLCKACCQCKGLEFTEKIKDIGSGLANSHKASSATVLNEEEVNNYHGILRNVFAKATVEVNKLSKNDTQGLLLCHYNLCAKLRRNL